MGYEDQLVSVAEGEATVAGRTVRYELQLYECHRCGRIQGVVCINGLAEIGGFGFALADELVHCTSCLSAVHLP